jgi:DNA-binding transcriptional regulator Cro
MTYEQAIKWGGGTQELLAAKLGIDQSSISKWGGRVPGFRQLQIERLSNRKLLADADAYKPAKSER